MRQGGDIKIFLALLSFFFSYLFFLLAIGDLMNISKWFLSVLIFFILQKPGGIIALLDEAW